MNPVLLNKVLDVEPKQLQKTHKACLICSSKSLKLLSGYESNYLVKCLNCSFVFSSPIPTEKELIAHYEGYSRDDYLPPLTIKRYNELLDEMEEHRTTNNLLDIGCGRGYFLEEAKKRGWNIYGTEFTDEAISICEKKGIIMREGILDSDSFDDNYFDVVTSFEVIEHINNPQFDLKHVNRILKIGGLFYCTTPNFNSLSRFYLKNKWNIIAYPEHLSYYTVSTISSVLKAYSILPVKVLTTGISLTRIKTSKSEKKENDPISVNSADEILRNKLEKSFFCRTIKKSLNFFLTLFSVGDTIKVYAIKTNEN